MPNDDTAGSHKGENSELDSRADGAASSDDRKAGNVEQEESPSWEHLDHESKLHLTKGHFGRELALATGDDRKPIFSDLVAVLMRLHVEDPFKKIKDQTAAFAFIQGVGIAGAWVQHLCADLCRDDADRDLVSSLVKAELLTCRGKAWDSKHELQAGASPILLPDPGPPGSPEAISSTQTEHTQALAELPQGPHATWN